MKRHRHKKKAIESRLPICDVLDSHKWVTKMEIQRLISGKPDLIIKAYPKTSD